MTAGLPGVGISGLFFVLSAIIMPVLEIGRTISGRSTAARWKLVLRQAGMAWVIIVVLERTVWLISYLLDVVRTRAHAGGTAVPTAGAAGSGTGAEFQTIAFPVAPVIIGLVVLAVVLLLGHLLHLLISARRAARKHRLEAAPRPLTTSPSINQGHVLPQVSDIDAELNRVAVAMAEG